MGMVMGGRKITGGGLPPAVCRGKTYFFRKKVNLVSQELYFSINNP